MTKPNTEIWTVKFDRCAKTGRVQREYWSKDDIDESPPGDRPQVVLYDEQGRATHFGWRKLGEVHREDGPAWLIINPENGCRHRLDRKPAIIRRHPISGDITSLSFFEHGVQRFWRKFNDLALTP